METAGTSVHWEQVRSLFDELIELSPATRARRLEEVRGGDPELHDEVVSLLDAFDGAGDFMGILSDSSDTPSRSESRLLVSAPLAEGAMIRSYRIVRELGRGGMGAVYLAHDQRLDRPVALKFLSPHFDSDDEATARLYAEARAAASIDHPNIATIFEINQTDDGRLFIAMAYYTGQTLKDRIAQGPIPVDEALDIAAQVACGLATAHQKGIVHRDVKPANVLLCENGPVKVLDFGLAKTAGQHLTRTGRTMGTVSYMSPEQVEGKPIDHRTDIWSLGVVLYEMLSGVRPFMAEFDAGILHAILNATPAPIRTLRPEIPPEVERILQKTLAKRPEARYQQAGEVVETLRQARQLQPSSIVLEPAQSGTVTFFFSDIEDSTELLHQLGPRYSEVLQEQQRLLRSVLQAWNGQEVDHPGDGFFAVFGRAKDAASAAVALQRAVMNHRWPAGSAVRLRVGLHTGEPLLASEGYVGLDVHRAARICSAAHGGQVLLSQVTRDLVEHELPERVHALDLGFHRLKGIHAPERLFQLVVPELPSSFPPLRAGGSLPGNLPVSPTEMVGRQKELASVKQLIREGARIVTLTGPGGTGKTRLSIRAAADLASDFDDGVCFVPLAPVTDPDLVPSTIAHVLGIREAGSLPVSEALFNLLRDKHGLIVLDNFEHVVEAAGFVANLMAACPLLTIMVTSRASLRIQGEYEFPVPPLCVPKSEDLIDTDRLSECESVTLFVRRAQAIRPDFVLTRENAAAIGEICARLDGLPLAIELAAARIKLLPPSAILSRLQRRLDLLTDAGRDRPARHRTLREAIAWSYDLLSPAEQSLFRWLGVFAGGFTISTFDAVCSAIQDCGFCSQDCGMNALDGLASLLDKNLIREEQRGDGEPRFTMLETIREFAVECLKAEGEEASARLAHLHYFLSLAEQAAANLRGAHQGEWLMRIEREYNNVRAALLFALSMDRILAVRFGIALSRFWLVRGYVNEGYEHMARILAEAGTGLDPALRAQILTGAAVLAYNMGLDDAQRLFSESLQLYRQLGDEAGIAVTLNHLGWLLLLRGEFEYSSILSEEALCLHGLADNAYGIALSYSNLAFVAFFQADYGLAEALCREALAWQRKTDDRRKIGVALSNLGLILHYQGRYEEALPLYQESTVLMDEVGERVGQCMNKNRIAFSLVQVGDTDRALMLLDEVLPQFRTMGHTWGTTESLTALGEALLSKGDLDRAEAVYQEQLERGRATGYWHGAATALCRLGDVRRRRGNVEGAHAMYVDSLRVRSNAGDKVGAAECLEGLAWVYTRTGQADRAARLLGAAMAIRDVAKGPIMPTHRSTYEALTAEVREHLGYEAYEAAWTEGREMTYAHAATYALGAR